MLCLGSDQWPSSPHFGERGMRQGRKESTAGRRRRERSDSEFEMYFIWAVRSCRPPASTLRPLSWEFRPQRSGQG